MSAIFRGVASVTGFIFGPADGRSKKRKYSEANGPNAKQLRYGKKVPRRPGGVIKHKPVEPVYHDAASERSTEFTRAMKRHKVQKTSTGPEVHVPAVPTAPPAPAVLEPEAPVDTASFTPLKKSEASVFEAIYRELFERIEGRDPVLNNARILRLEAKVNAIKDDEKRFIEGFRLTTNLIVGSQRGAETAAAFQVIKGAYWAFIQLRSEHTSALQAHIFSTPTALNDSALSTTILSSRLSPLTTYDASARLCRQWFRYSQVSTKIGWKALSILSFSSAFRNQALTATNSDWDTFFAHLKALKVSIHLVGDFFCKDWRATLSTGVGVSIDTLNLGGGDYHGHHHLWAVPLDGSAKAAKPVEKYEVIEESILGPNTTFTSDPRKHTVIDGIEATPVSLLEECTLCTEGECTCASNIWYPCRVELILAGARGIGVRALQGILKNQVIGEYVGEITPLHEALYPDDFYCLTGFRGTFNTTAKAKGNWTRFANHSCQPNCRIAHLPWRGKVLSVFRAARKIEMFEEITVNYGKGYFGEGGLEVCLCPAKVHVADPDYVQY